MKRTISKRAREQAAIICAIMASSPRWRWASYSVASAIGASWTAEFLAVKAMQRLGEQTTVNCAEAEAKLRTGWTP